MVASEKRTVFRYGGALAPGWLAYPHAKMAEVRLVTQTPPTATERPEESLVEFISRRTAGLRKAGSYLDTHLAFYGRASRRHRKGMIVIELQAAFSMVPV